MYLEDLVSEINRKLLVLKDKEKLVLWGAAESTVRLYEHTELSLYSFIYIVDNDTSKIGASFFGNIITSPNDICWEEIDAVVISSYRYEEQIYEELRNKHKYNKVVVKLNAEGQRSPFFQYISKRLMTAPDCYKDILEKNVKYKNLHKGERAFVLATGPSINQVDVRKLKDEYSIAVSGFYNHKDYSYINPKYYCIVDSLVDGVVKREDVKKEFQQLGEIIEKLDTVCFFGIHDREIIQEIEAYKNKAVNYVCSAAVPTCGIEKIDITQNIFAPTAGPIMNIQIALYMGFKEIYLLGVDHSTLRKGRYHHFYPSHKFIYASTDDGKAPNGEISDYGIIIKAAANVWKQYEQMKMIAENIYDAKIYNASKGSCLDVFERVNYDDLFI